MVEYFYLARDRETGMIVDSGFWTFSRTKKTIKYYMREHCDLCGYDMIDFDGPFFVWPRWFRHYHRPKWEKLRPQSISADDWEHRLKSKGELVAYKLGFQAGQNRSQNKETNE
jgi:hypothetical protein